MNSISSSRHLVAKVLLLVVLCAVLLPFPGASGQVTFSRDWNAGKRAMADTPVNGVTECSAIWRSVNNLCAAVTVE
uniref:Adipokinetic hormone 2 n=1 Tax=Anopheles epiroticus TaxID=199890 RepID=A0A182P730_9DIPT